MIAQGKTTVATNPSYKQYLDNSWVNARRRLMAIEGMADHATLRRIEALGIRDGWRCLEVGCGGGSIARWMSQRAAPGGHVLAVDLDTRFMTDAAGPTLEVLEQDIVTMPLPEGVFELVHARMVLQHLAQREQLLERLITSLKPGGWLFLEEMETFSFFQNETGPFLQVVETMLAMGRAAGTAVEWARTLPGTFQRLGLKNVRAEGEMIFFCGGSQAAEFHRLTAEQFWPHAERMRLLTREQFDQFSAQLMDPSTWLYGPTIFGIWGQRPPA